MMPNSSPASHPLYQELAASYQVCSKSFVCGRHVQDLLCVADPDVLLDQLDPDDLHNPAVLDERLPYWAHVWPAARQLAGLLLDAILAKATPTLELGCGLGLVSAAAAAAGLTVSVSDYEPDAVRFARYNSRAASGQPARGLVLDWRDPPEIPRVPVILAADVAYEARAFEPLARSFEALLMPSGQVLLSEPNRRIAEGFFHILRQRGWSCETLYHDTLATSYRLMRPDVVR